MTSTNYPLIVGAGPVGLAASLFLAGAGIRTRIIDCAQERSSQSKALAVNPRTLQLLEPTGVTERMLELGAVIHGAQFWRDHHVLAQLSFAELKHKYPFMLALSQATTERLLEETLGGRGIAVERGVKLVSCRVRRNGVEAELQKSDGERRTIPVPWLLAADGAHSTARDQLDIDFQGSTFPTAWHLSDLPLRSSLAPDFAHVFFLREGGFVFAIRDIEGRGEDRRDGVPVWRVMGNVADPVERLSLASAAGAPLWQSTFHISHRINARMQQGNVFFAGDAAHVHSPVGARGMNLGIEDVWVLAELVKRNACSRYEELRWAVDRKIVKRIELLSRVARGESGLSRFVRSVVLPRSLEMGSVHERFVATVTGLDHDIGLDRN